MISKAEYNKLKEEYDRLEELRKDVRALVNHILRVRRKCETNKLFLMASLDPYKPLTTEEQQGPMVSKLFKLTEDLKEKMK